MYITSCRRNLAGITSTTLQYTLETTWSSLLFVWALRWFKASFLGLELYIRCDWNTTYELDCERDCSQSTYKLGFRAVQVVLDLTWILLIYEVGIGRNVRGKLEDRARFQVLPRFRMNFFMTENHRVTLFKMTSPPIRLLRHHLSNEREPWRNQLTRPVGKVRCSKLGRMFSPKMIELSKLFFLYFTETSVESYSFVW